MSNKEFSSEEQEKVERVNKVKKELKELLGISVIRISGSRKVSGRLKTAIVLHFTSSLGREQYITHKICYPEGKKPFLDEGHYYWDKKASEVNFDHRVSDLFC